MSSGWWASGGSAWRRATHWRCHCIGSRCARARACPAGFPCRCQCCWPGLFSSYLLVGVPLFTRSFKPPPVPRPAHSPPLLTD
jgi:hypothetical protein